MCRWSGTKSWLCRIGIMLMILGLARVPVPMPDFHGSGHSDGAGDACSGHGHLLPGHLEEAPRGAPVLSWRWVLLNAAELCGESSTLGTEAPNCHPDWAACSHDPSPQYIASRAARRIAAAMDRVPSIDRPALLAGWSWAQSRPAPALRARSFVATYPPRTSIASLLQRWTC